MKKLLLILLSLVSVGLGADTLSYWKAGANGVFSNAGNWNNSIVPNTVNRIAIHNGDTSNYNDTVDATSIINQIQFVNYNGLLVQKTGVTITIRPPTAKSFFLGGTNNNLTGLGTINFSQVPNTNRCTLDLKSTHTGTFTFLAGNIVVKKLINNGTINIAPTSSGDRITFTGDTCSGVTFTPGINGAGQTDSIFFGSGVFDFQTINFATRQTGTSYQYWESARFKCGGNLTRSTSPTTITDVGTSKFIFDSTTNSILANLNGTRIFYDMEIAKTGAATCSTATATDTINCHEMRITTGRLAMIAPLYCNSYLNLSTDTSRMFADKYINTSFYRASTANAIADTFKTYFVTNVNHDISCDTNITLGRFIVSAGRATALTNLRMVKFTLPVASKLTITAGKIVRIDSTYDLEGTAGNLDSIVSGTAGVAAKLWLPANDTLSYTYVKDINSTDSIYLDSTCVNGGGNTNVFDVSYCTGPAITTHPASTSALAPATAIFSVAATGTATLSYQWQRNNSSISGATTSSYTTPRTNKTADNGKAYRVIVSNACGADTSNAAILTVKVSFANKWQAFKSLRASAFKAP